MRGLGDAADVEARIYFTGGATAVLHGWRESTIDVDLAIEPESDALYRAIPRLKESLPINVEFAAPHDFIPALPGWRDRSPFIERYGRACFHHYDLYAQVLAKLERRHAQDLDDVRALVARGLVEVTALVAHFRSIEPHLYRFPAIDPPSFRRAVEDLAAGGG